MRMKKKLGLLCVGLMLLMVAVSCLWDKRNEQGKLQETTVQIKETTQILEITEEEDYLKFAQNVSDGQSYENWEIELCADLDFSNYENLGPIGELGDDVDPIIFEGIFDGNGHSIHGLSIQRNGQDAAMFAYLGGTVKNLIITDSVFIGDKCGAIAADTEDAAIYNCYIDAVVEGDRPGTVVSRLSGQIINCVTPVGERYEALKKGRDYLCYNAGECDSNIMNQNLMFLNGYFEDDEICVWENTESGISMTKEKAELIESVVVNLNASGTKLPLEGYYSINQEKWCIALPATYLAKELYLDVTTTFGQKIYLSKPELESEVMVDIGLARYPVKFLCADHVDTLYITLANQKDLSYVHENKYEEIPGIVTVLEQDGTVGYSVLEGFYGHGNDSWNEVKKSYNLKFDSYVNLLGMGANEDFALLAGYRRNSLMSYVTTNEMIQEIGFDYAPEFRLVNVYVSGEYVGVYFLAEKIKLDKNRIDITNVYEKTLLENANSLAGFEQVIEKTSNSNMQKYYYRDVNNPEDITGGYLLEIDNEDYSTSDSRFITERNNCVVLKRAMYSSKEQVDYISEYWQEFEDAIYSENGYNAKGKYYTEYIDMESFALQWLMYELEQELSLNSSLYYYKESDVSGDGLIHACYPWDIEHSYVLSEFNDQIWHTGENSGALEGFWEALYIHEDFKAEVRKQWFEKFVPAVEKMLSDDPTETENGLKNLNWYRQNMIDMHKLENSRWTSSYPWDRLSSIEEFLKIRLEKLTELL